jgi:hypothetical protein
MRAFTVITFYLHNIISYLNKKTLWIKYLDARVRISIFFGFISCSFVAIRRSIFRLKTLIKIVLVSSDADPDMRPIFSFDADPDPGLFFVTRLG